MVGDWRVPLMVIGSTVPEPCFANSGSTAFRKNDFAPVVICDTFAFMLKCPEKSSASVRIL